MVVVKHFFQTDFIALRCSPALLGRVAG
jgi:hypothetical protein